MKILTFFLAMALLKILSPPESIAVIVNIENPVTDLTIGEVRSHWMQRPKKRWGTLNKLIKPVDLKDKCDAKKMFYGSLIKMPVEAVESYFSTRQYQSGENPPIKMKNDAEVIEFVANEVGAIGYVLASSLSSKELSKVKVVLSVSIPTN
jgi:ABC-type phosphate transport system substrate-binding protein